MALGETQTLLARLFTDAALRAQFFTSPVEVAKRNGLDEADARRLAQIDPAEIEAFARSLVGKRVLDLRKSMPLTARALDARFEILSIDAVGAPSRARPAADAGALLRRLEELSARDDHLGFVADVARFEFAFIEAARPGIWLKRFHHDMAPLVSALRAGASVEARRRRTIGVWARAPGARLRWAMFGMP